MDKIEALRKYLRYDPETGLFYCVGNRGRARDGMVAGHAHSEGYVEFRCAGYRMFAHIAAWAMMTGRWPTHQVDHRNGIRNDNRWSNLRAASQQANSANMKRRKSNKTGFKGVSPYKGKYCAYIHVGGKTKYLGIHSTPGLAHDAYCRAAAETWGSFARAA